MRFLALIWAVDAAIDVISCYQGTRPCCPGGCCDRAVKDCRDPAAPLMMIVDFTAALGNIIQTLHDAVILAKLLGRALLLPPFWKSDPAIDMLHLAEAFAIDMIVTQNFHWPSTCRDDRNSSLNILEVSGSRAGPFRDHFQWMQSGAMPLALQFYPGPKFNEIQGMWTYERGARGEVTHEGQYWYVKFPRSVRVQTWERSLQALQTVGHGGHGCADSPFLPPDFSRIFGALQLWRQHSCLVPAAKLFAETRCLIFMFLAKSLHLGEHWVDHLHFFRNFRFVPKVGRLAEMHSRRLRRPFWAIHLRPYMFGAEGINESTTEKIILNEVRDVFQRLRKRWGVVPDTFLASESMKENNTLRVLKLLTDMGSNVLTTEDTKPEGGPTGAHVAVDATICTLADHFLATGVSSLSQMIVSMRFAAERETEVSFIPRDRRDLKIYEEAKLDLFPQTSQMPSESDLSRFFLNLEEHVASVSSRNELYCGTQGHNPPFDRFMAFARSVLPFGGQRTNSVPVSKEICEVVWSKIHRACPPVALIANMHWLIGLQNASLGLPSPGFQKTSSEELHLEKARFAFRLWQLLYNGDWSTVGWSAPGLKTGVRQLLRLLAEREAQALEKTRGFR